MSVIARFSVPAEQFPLGEALEVREGIRVRLESMIPTGDVLIPYFWVPSDDADAVVESLGDSSLVADVRVVDRVGTESLFRVEWSAEVNGLIDAIGDSDGVLLEARGTGAYWSFRMRFPERQQLSAFYQACVDQGLSPELDEVNNSFESSGDVDDDLTTAQREALTVALDSGYFSVPRETTLKELAAHLNVSDTATSQRLRRGLTALLSSTLQSPSAGEGSDREPASDATDQSSQDR